MSSGPKQPSDSSPSPTLFADGRLVNDAELARVFNTALISTRAAGTRDLSGQIMEQVESPAFRAILSAVRAHARAEGLGEKQAAEQIVTAFRKVDSLWTEYLVQEGIERVRG
jgi:hypothetical protein